MVDAVTQFFRCLTLLLVFMTMPRAVFAHRLDEYLQATLVSIEPGKIRLEINLTPGVAVAEQVLARIDRDHDGVISSNEAAAYADLLKRGLIVQLDGRNVRLNCDSFTFPEPAEFRTGSGIILMEFSVKTGVLAPGPHKLSFDNRHLPAISVYLFNAALPRSEFIRITGQKRNETQSIGEIAFDFLPTSKPSKRPKIAASFGVLLSLLVIAGAWRARKTRLIFAPSVYKAGSS